MGRSKQIHIRLGHSVAVARDILKIPPYIVALLAHRRSQGVSLIFLVTVILVSPKVDLALKLAACTNGTGVLHPRSQPS